VRLRHSGIGPGCIRYRRSRRLGQYTCKVALHSRYPVGIRYRYHPQTAAKQGGMTRVSGTARPHITVPRGCTPVRAPGSAPPDLSSPSYVVLGLNWAIGSPTEYTHHASVYAGWS
jgi:hypothetical protein